MPTVSAPGKLHLIGEYAVMDGHPAILAATNLRTTVTAERADILSITHGSDHREWSLAEARAVLAEYEQLWKQGAEKKDFSAMNARLKGEHRYLLLAAANSLKKLGIMSGASLQAETTIPLGAGMGSSGALAVAFAGAIAKAYGKDLPPAELNKIAYSTEQFFHGTPSGGDNSTSCFGGLLQFRKTPSGPEITPLDIGYELTGFIAVDAGKRTRTTAEMVQFVRSKDPAFVSERFKMMGEGSKAMLEALRARDFSKVQALMALAQRCLKELGVSTPAIDQIAAEAQALGGAAKACGAAGGGTVLCYHKEPERLMARLRELGFDPIPITLGVEGLRAEPEGRLGED